MKKRFKAKKRKKFKIMYFILIIVVVYLLYQLLSWIFIGSKLATSNEDFIIALLNDSNHHILYEKQNNNILKKVLNKLINTDTSKPVALLENVFGYELNNNTNVASDVYEETEIPTNTEYIKDPDPSIIDDPRVYIYNSHQLEDYNASNFEEYNITPNVLMASYLLKEKLNYQNIPTIVETSNVRDFLNLNGWDYASSYKASRFFVTDILNKYNNLDLIIDLHRDAISKAYSTVTIDDKNYAKVLFVVGLDHANYGPNLELANKLNDMINSKYPSLTRGVITKSGNGVDGIYNQDLSPKMVLIECGGNENSIDEVMNTIEILANVITEYMGD